MSNSGNGYPRGNPNWVVDKISAIERQLRNLSTPSGTQVNGLVGQVQQALATIRETVTETIQSLSYTRTEIEERIASTPAAVKVNGTLTVTGKIDSSTTRNNTLISNYATLYVDGTGEFGINPSTVRVKTNINPVNLSSEIEALYTIGLVSFQYIKAVEEYGDEEAPVEVGTIAEYAEEVGLGRWVIRDEEGEVSGINYERLTIPLIATVQDLNRRLRAIEEKLAASDATESSSAPSE